MTRRLRVGIVQMSMSDDVDANIKTAVRGVAEAARMGAEVVCLPELFGWKYFPAERKSVAQAQSVPGLASRAVSQAARLNKATVVGGSLYEKSGKKRYNTCLVFDDHGRLLSKYRKVHLPQDEHYFEQDYFDAGSSYIIARTPKAEIGTLICFDQWYPEPARILRLKGAQILFYPTAIGFVDGIEQTEGSWQAAWEAVQVGHAVANSVIVCAVNRVGKEGKTKFWGGSFVCDQFGKVLFRADDKVGVHVVDCDLQLSETVEEGWGFMRNRRDETYSPILK